MPKYANFHNNLQSTTPPSKLKAIQTFLKYDSYLINNNIHEHAILHRLTLYFDELFPNYYVDCEWNKVSNDPKLIGIDGILKSIKRVIDNKIISKENNTKLVLFEELRHLLNEHTKTFTDQPRNSYVNVVGEKNIQFKKIRPDIIIHTRGTKQNICVIEVKKENNTHEHEKAKLYDFIKLYVLTNWIGHTK